MSTETVQPDTFPPTWAVARHVAALREHLPTLAQCYHIKRLGVFGSYVRNEQRPDSDLDMLVEFSDLSRLSLLTIAGLQIDLSDRLGVPVDLALREGLRPIIGRYILDEVVWLPRAAHADTHIQGKKG